MEHSKKKVNEAAMRTLTSQLRDTVTAVSITNILLALQLSITNILFEAHLQHKQLYLFPRLAELNQRYLILIPIGFPGQTVQKTEILFDANENV